MKHISNKKSSSSKQPRRTFSSPQHRHNTYKFTPLQPLSDEVINGDVKITINYNTKDGFCEINKIRYAAVIEYLAIAAASPFIR